MNRQLEQLLLLEPEQQIEAATRMPPADIDRTKARLRAFAELKNSVGFRLFMEAIQQEAANSLNYMEKADNPTLFTKFGANYWALHYVTLYVDSEIANLTALLKSFNAL